MFKVQVINRKIDFDQLTSLGVVQKWQYNQKTGHLVLGSVCDGPTLQTVVHSIEYCVDGILSVDIGDGFACRMVPILAE